MVLVVPTLVSKFRRDDAGEGIISFTTRRCIDGFKMPKNLTSGVLLTCTLLRTQPRFNETYIKVKGKWKYLYRAVDSNGNTLDFMFSAKCNTKAAERFFRKALQAAHNQPPRVINVDQNPAYPKAITALKAEAALATSCELRQNKYFNNIVEQDHPFIKKLVNPSLGFKSFHAARKTIAGYKAMNMIRKGQVVGLSKGNIVAQVKFIAYIFRVVA